MDVWCFNPEIFSLIVAPFARHIYLFCVWSFRVVMCFILRDQAAMGVTHNKTFVQDFSSTGRSGLLFNPGSDGRSFIYQRGADALATAPPIFSPGPGSRQWAGLSYSCWNAPTQWNHLCPQVWTLYTIQEQLQQCSVWNCYTYICHPSPRFPFTVCLALSLSGVTHSFQTFSILNIREASGTHRRAYCLASLNGSHIQLHRQRRVYVGELIKPAGHLKFTAKVVPCEPAALQDMKCLKQLCGDSYT